MVFFVCRSCSSFLNLLLSLFHDYLDDRCIDRVRTYYATLIHQIKKQRNIVLTKVKEKQIVRDHLFLVPNRQTN